VFVTRSFPSPKSASHVAPERRYVWRAAKAEGLAHSTTLFKRLPTRHPPRLVPAVPKLLSEGWYTLQRGPAESETGGGDTLKRGHQAEILWLTAKYTKYRKSGNRSKLLMVLL
jgi:hypothetical protein